MSADANPTSDQENHILTLIRQAGITRARLQLLINSGLLADLLGADPGRINRENFRHICGLPPDPYPVVTG